MVNIYFVKKLLPYSQLIKIDSLLASPQSIFSFTDLILEVSGLVDEMKLRIYSITLSPTGISFINSLEIQNIIKT